MGSADVVGTTDDGAEESVADVDPSLQAETTIASANIAATRRGFLLRLIRVISEPHPRVWRHRIPRLPVFADSLLGMIDTAVPASPQSVGDSLPNASRSVRRFTLWAAKPCSERFPRTATGFAGRLLHHCEQVAVTLMYEFNPNNSNVADAIEPSNGIAMI
jgi:hypothetical protein